MAEQLLDRSQLSTAPADDDAILLRDRSDLTDGASGTDVYQEVFDLLKGRAFHTIQGCLALKASGNSSRTALEAGDFVLYQNGPSNIFIIATIKAAVTTIPTDLQNKTLAYRWYEGSDLNNLL